MEYITLRLDSTNEVEQWYGRHNYFIVLLHRRHVSIKLFASQANHINQYKNLRKKTNKQVQSTTVLLKM